MIEAKKNIVRERLLLIDQLEAAKQHFRGLHLRIKKPGNRVDHPYKHYDALKIYLYLTCFDILGQPDEWMDFGAWLKAKKKKYADERDQILEKCPAHDIIGKMIFVQEEYAKIYGVKSSFYRFMRESISPDHRQMLMSSIYISKTIKPAVYHADGSFTVAEGKFIDVSDEEKEKFLFSARNSFTHKGISFGDAAGGIFPDWTFEPIVEDGVAHWLIHEIFSDIKNGTTYQYSVRRWPFVLREVIEEALNKD